MVSKLLLDHLLVEHFIFQPLDDPSSILIQHPLTQIHYTVYKLTSPAALQVKFITISYCVSFGSVNSINYPKFEDITVLYSYETDNS